MQKSIQYIVIIIFLASFSLCKAQQPEEVYKKPLKEVLANVEKTYHVKLKYDDKIVKDLTVNYATWRFTSDVKNTLDNILKPLDLIYTQTDNNTYEISQYEYYRRSEEEGKNTLINCYLLIQMQMHLTNEKKNCVNVF